MCGIFGAIGKDYEMSTVKILGLLNEDRGNQATGMYNGIRIIKETYPAKLFFTGMNKEQGSSIFLGHTRLATMGDKSDPNNAHPFHIGNIVGAHNGCISNTTDLAKLLCTRYEVDSQYIFHLLSCYKPEEAVNKLEGSFAIWWVDTRDTSKVMFYRKSNPIHMMGYKETIYFSSDSRPLKIATGYDDTKIAQLKENTLYTIDVNTLNIEREDCIYKEKETYNYNRRYWKDNYDDSYWFHGYSGNNSNNIITEEDCCYFCGKELTSKEMKGNYFGSNIDECFCNECYKNLRAKKECPICGNKLTDKERMDNILDEVAYCNNCYKDMLEDEEIYNSYRRL